MSEDWIEIEGRNKDEAIERACNALNTTLSYLDYELLNPSGSKIRAKKAEKPRVVATKAMPATGEAPIAPSEEPRSRPRLKSRADIEAEASRPKIQVSSPSRPRRPKDDEEKANVEAPNARIRVRPTPQVAEAPDVPEPEYLSEPTELGLKAQEVLTHILGLIESGTSVSLRETKEEIRLEIKSDGSGLFIGKHGQTLEAFQHVVAKILNLDRNAERRLVLDSEGYRSRREDSLKAMAHRIADRVMRYRRSVTMDPMGAMDRRIIHLALAEHPQVMTKSVGEGMERKIVVSFKGRGGSEGRSSEGRRGGGRSQGREGRGGSRSGGRQERSDGRLVTRARLHDSYDVPPAPNMDIFPEDIDELMDLPEEELQERMAMMQSSSEKEEE